MWLSHTRSDCIFEISQMTQINMSHLANDILSIINTTNRAIYYATRHPVKICLPALHRDKVKVVGYSDASSVTNRVKAS